MPRFLIGLVLLPALAGCGHATLHRTESSLLAANSRAGHAFGPEISAEDFAAHVRVLASDDFGGREPGTEGEDKTVKYLSEQFQRLGLAPGNGGSYFQTVPMVRSRLDARHSRLSLDRDGQDRKLVLGDEAVVVSRRGQAEVDVADSEVVFVGYGIHAPEQDWDDYAGLDVRGKTVVVLVNDPGFASGDERLFEGRRMTYYGRWTYKFEEAARQGAAAALIVHDSAAAGYGWDVVRDSWGGDQHNLRVADDPAPRLAAEGWLSARAANDLFRDAGLDLEQLRAAAARRGFRPLPLAGTRLSFQLRSAISNASSRNVIARLTGSRHPDEAILYTAHWDHLGTRREGMGDRVFNGAIDNATGVAGVLEIAEQFSVQDPRPERSVVFLLTTLEESGLLGSQYYVAHPVLPLAQTVADINLDAMPLVGPTRDLVVVGLGYSDLDELLRPIAAEQGRTLTAESAPEKGYFYRSDQLSFARAGVPVLYIKGGVDHRTRGADYGRAWLDGYTAKRYHKPDDEFDADWNLRGVVMDLNAVYRVGKRLSLGREWPNYRVGSPFRAPREASRPTR